jgi:tetratricopeptide (TPR) repeat protein
MRGPLHKRLLIAALGLLAVCCPAGVLLAQSPPIGKSALDTAAPLLDQLKSAQDETAARALEQQVWLAWTGSGNDEVDSLMRKSSALMQAQAFDEALAVLDGVVAKAPKFAEGWNKRATLLFMMSDYDRSMADIGKVLDLEPRHFGALSGLGLIRSAKGDKLGAIAAYKKVLEIDPQNHAAKASIDELGKELEGNPI